MIKRGELTALKFGNMFRITAAEVERKEASTSPGRGNDG
jgi:hypothetical protein